MIHEWNHKRNPDADIIRAVGDRENYQQRITFTCMLLHGYIAICSFAIFWRLFHELLTRCSKPVRRVTVSRAFGPPSLRRLSRPTKRMWTMRLAFLLQKNA